MVCRESETRAVEAEALRRHFETPADRPRIGAGAHEAAPEGRIVLLALTSLADERHDVLGPIRQFLFKPVAEDVAHLERQPEEDVTGLANPRRMRGLEDPLDLAVIEAGNHRG